MLADDLEANMKYKMSQILKKEQEFKQQIIKEEAIKKDEEAK